MSNNQNSETVTYQIEIGETTITKGLVGLSVTDRINRIPRARLELNYSDIDAEETQKNYDLEPAQNFDQETQATKTQFLPGENITIQIGKEGTNETVFTGYITKQNLVAKNNGTLMLYVNCKHATHKMTLATQTRFLHEASSDTKLETIDDDQILKKIVDDYDEVDLKIIDQPTDTFDHENIVQYNCSDWDFLVMRAEATGRVCKTEANEIQLIKPAVSTTATHELTLGKDIFEYEAEYDETQVASEIAVNSWDIEGSEEKSDLYTNRKANSEASKIQNSRYFNHGSDIDTNEAKSWSDNKLNRQELGKILGTVKTHGNTAIALGDSIAMSGFNSVWDTAKLISGIKHVIKKGIWQTYLQSGLSSQSHAETFNINTNRQNDLLPSSDGLLYGKVISYKESDAGYELIEVEIATTDKNSNQSIYARLVTPSAGEKGGFIFRPYPNDEVVIGFINNDPRFPVILGSLYNHQNEFPYALDGEDQTEVGFSFGFDGNADQAWKMSMKDNETMTIASPNGQSLILDDKEKSIAMAFDDSNSIKITSEGIEMDASKIVIKGTNGIELTGMKIEASADTSMKLEGGTQLELEGKVTASLKGQITQIN